MTNLRKLFIEVRRKHLTEADTPDPQSSAQSDAAILIFLDKLKNSATFSQMSRQLQMPTDKFRAIVKFGSLLGIPEERFVDFIQQQEANVKTKKH